MSWVFKIFVDIFVVCVTIAVMIFAPLLAVVLLYPPTIETLDAVMIAYFILAFANGTYIGMKFTK